MVGSDMASPVLAISALAFGIAAGDVGLYGIGWTAREFRFLRKRLPIRRTRKLRGWLDARKTPVLFCSRFLPGTRLPTYLTFGFLRLSLNHFVSVMTIAALVWVTFMVLFVSSAQRLLAPLHGGAGLIAGLAVAILMITLSHQLVKRSRLNISIDSADAPHDDGPQANSDTGGIQ
nr:VTT domain-containing protein [Kordiimonas marina]